MLLDEDEYNEWDQTIRVNQPLAHIIHDLFVALRKANLKDDTREHALAVILQLDERVGLFRKCRCLPPDLGS